MHLPCMYHVRLALPASDIGLHCGSAATPQFRYQYTTTPSQCQQQNVGAAHTFFNLCMPIHAFWTSVLSCATGGPCFASFDCCRCTAPALYPPPLSLRVCAPCRRSICTNPPVEPLVAKTAMDKHGGTTQQKCFFRITVTFGFFRLFVVSQLLFSIRRH